MSRLIKATKTDKHYGYEIGDILRIKSYGYTGVVRAENLTEPLQYGRRGDCLLSDVEFVYYTPPTPKPSPVEKTVTTFKLFGIPVWKRTVGKVVE